MSNEHKNSTIELHIDIAAEHIAQKINPLELLAQQTSLSKQKLKDAMAKGAVWLSTSGASKSAKPIRRKNAKLKAGNQLSLYYNPHVLAQQVDNPTLVADEGDYSVWNKPYGVWSQSSKWGDHCSIGRLVEQHFEFKRSSFVVHRLDRAANGLILIAHNKKTSQLLSDLFAKRKVEKVYQATVTGKFDKPQTIELPIDDKKAISHVSLIDYDSSKNQSRLEVKIETGRKHQIRKHLASIGFPIIGDRLYGQAQAEDINLQLTAYQLAFDCPLSAQSKTYQL
ncbi:MAG: RNA pseudouridine synthase [Gammaproteobacteria bacterium]|nr:RNA pseudouridine synthase [Gammaproteobacteria bacterium]